MKESKTLKVISYILLPVLIMIIILSVIYSFGKDSYSKGLNNYIDTSEFGKNYMMKLSQIARQLIYKESDYAYIEDKDINIYYIDLDDFNFDVKLKDNYILIIYKNKAITNVELTDETTINLIKKTVDMQEGEKLSIINGSIKSNPLKGDILTYKDFFENAYYYTEKDGIYEKSKEKIYERSKFEDFQIYSTYKKELVLNDYDEFMINIIQGISRYEDAFYLAVPVCSVLVIMIVTYLVISVGHTRENKEININDLDKIPLEILLTVLVIALGIVIFILKIIGGTTVREYYKLAICGVITTYFVIYTVFALVVTTIIKRIKAKMFWKTTIIGMVVTWITNIFGKFINAVILSKKTAHRVTILVLIYTFMIIILPVFFGKSLGLVLDIIITIYALYQVTKRINSLKTIESHLKKIYEGQINEKLDKDSICKEFKDITEYINGISSGFEKMVQDGIKSERLKTELITNVSHDIKTPLTSIINYVDLLKKENIENEKAREYIEILEAKSNRLKRLTEDLIEASKASSGNVKLNLEKINIVELIKQATGEFEDRFNEKELDIITKLPDEEILIEADNRYMYRIIENLFSNISKYALDSSRVYIDTLLESNKVKISIKNISKDKLNISADELMQRFVRGDKSRTTEGSGLGLSISKSLTELQKGIFNIQIDGDLFKVELEFERIN